MGKNQDGKEEKARVPKMNQRQPEPSGSRRKEKAPEGNQTFALVSLGKGKDEICVCSFRIYYTARHGE